MKSTWFYYIRAGIKPKIIWLWTLKVSLMWCAQSSDRNERKVANQPNS